MKKLFTILLCVVSLQLYSQKSNKTIYEKNFGSLDCEFERVIDLSTSDTSYYIYCGFQNQKYSSITDLGSIFLTNQTDLLKTIEDLKECVKYMDDKSISFEIGIFKIYDFSKGLYINDGDKYTTLSKKNVLKWIKWLEGCVVN